MSHKYGPESSAFKSTTAIVSASGLKSKLRGKLPPKFTMSGVFLPYHAGIRGPKRKQYGCGKSLAQKSHCLRYRKWYKGFLINMQNRRLSQQKGNRFIDFLRGPE